MPIARPAAQAQHPALRLEGNDVTFLESVEGGGIFANVIDEPGSPSGYAKKHIGAPEFGAFTCRVGLITSDALFDWIAASWQVSAPRHGGAILTLDANFEVTREREFSAAYIEEVAFPALDASSNETGAVSVRIVPGNIVDKPGSGKLPPVVLSKQKLWRTANFHLDIDGVDTNYVTRIDSFAIRLNPGRPSPVINFPYLDVRVAGVGAQSWIDWHRSFVIDGKNADQFEKGGAIRFLAADMKSELARIDLQNVGIFALVPETVEGGKSASVLAQLYCERMQLKAG